MATEQENKVLDKKIEWELEKGSTQGICRAESTHSHITPVTVSGLCKVWAAKVTYTLNNISGN